MLGYLYEDRGCATATAHLGRQSKCLECPFEKCVLELPKPKRKRCQEQRDNEIVRLRRDKGMAIGEIASELQVSSRTINRILKRDA